MSFRTRLAAKRSALRLSVDPISNTIAITLANPLYAPSQLGLSSLAEEDWGSTLANGNLSDDLLPVVLHEITHHSSLQTPVGASLCALAVSHTSVALVAARDSDSLIGPGRDRILYSAADLYLTPLLEGLALFQEFDAVPSNAPISTWASQIATLLFCRADVLSALHAGNDIEFPLKSKIEEARVSATFVSRKRDLLRKGLGDPDGYLLGYLLIKLLWGDLIARNKIWRNTDLFVMFVNDYFFNDFFLAQFLVQPPGDSLDAHLDKLKEYLSYRLLLLSRNCQIFGKEFVLYHEGHTKTRPSYQAFVESRHELLQQLWTMRTLRNVHFMTPDFVTVRTHPRLLAAPATVTIDELGNFEAVFFDGMPSFHGPALAAARSVDGSPSSGDGSVEAIILLPQNDRRNFRILICTFLDKELVATFDPESRVFNDDDAATACDRLGSFLAYESFAVQVENELPNVDPKSRLAKYLAQYSGSQGAKRMLDLWSPFALVPDVGKEEIPGVADFLNREGLSGALQLDSSSLRSLARFSLFPLDPAAPNTTIKEDDIATIAGMNSRSREVLGFNLLVIKDGNLESGRI